MKTVREKEQAALEAYNMFWEANLSANMEIFASYLVDDFSIFGSANGEEFFNKKDAVKFYTLTSGETSGNVQLRNKNINTRFLNETSVVVMEQSQLFVLIENNWTFYGNLRISCILNFVENKWMAVHQHGSFPDHRTESGQQLAAEKIEKENLELREAVQRRTVELQHKNRELESALEKLKSTQSQLIQAEKMASLGELTAGIAHEIQNPLNFVNNFSEVSKELLDEMKTDLDNGNSKDAKDIANDVIQNLEKINHHGKRADAIVKGMLQHSNAGNGKKELTDINKLADEYLRLAYHGLRAKDKSFNATMKTDFDESIGNINIIPQDIGRVILNLVTNAFYAVNEKKIIQQTSTNQVQDGQPDKSYEPIVSISTKKVGDKVEIMVADNGNGIPQKVIDKIFQPFFTTKPTGQGTGLGLSLAYDIVKAHGGELMVQTNENKGPTFTISLPIN